MADQRRATNDRQRTHCCRELVQTPSLHEASRKVGVHHMDLRKFSHLPPRRATEIMENMKEFAKRNCSPERTMNTKAYKITKRSTPYRVIFYVCLLCKLFICGERPKRFDLMSLVIYETIRNSLKRDLQRSNEVSRRTLLRAMRLHSKFWEWLLRTNEKHPIKKETLDSVWELAFRCGRVHPKLKRRVKELVLQTANIKGRQKRMAEVLDIAGLPKYMKVYRACLLDEDKLNDGEFGWWWALDDVFAIMVGVEHRNRKKGQRLAIYSVWVSFDKIAFWFSKKDEYPEIILFDITRDTPTLMLEYAEP